MCMVLESDRLLCRLGKSFVRDLYSGAGLCLSLFDDLAALADDGPDQGSESYCQKPKPSVRNQQPTQVIK